MPQIFNVLRGDEFSRPRPCLPRNSSATSPGAAASRRVACLTGYWQVKRLRITATFKEMIAGSIFTSEHVDLADLTIMFRPIPL